MSYFVLSERLLCRPTRSRPPGCITGIAGRNWGQPPISAIYLWSAAERGASGLGASLTPFQRCSSACHDRLGDDPQAQHGVADHEDQHRPLAAQR